MADAVRPSSVQVVRAGPEHAEAMAEFFRQVWDPAATADSVRRERARAAATNPLGAGEDIPTFLFLSEERALGYVTTIPARLWTAGAERRAHWVKGLWVLPEHRNGPIGFLLLKEAVRHLGCSLAMVVQEAPRRLFGALGFADLGALPNYLRILRPGRVLQRIDLERIELGGLPGWAPDALRMARRTGLATAAGAAAAVATLAWTASVGRADGYEIALADELDPDEVDRLWARARGRLAAAAVRDGATLRWRYGSVPDSPYSFATARRRGVLEGMAVVRRPRSGGEPRLSGLRVAVVSEALFPPHHPAAGRAALAAAERLARVLGADALLCSTSHRALLAALPRRGFLRLPGNVHFLVRDPEGTCELPNALAEWWLTRGDSDADDTF